MSGSTGSGMKETIKKISSECEYLQSLFIDREARMNQEEAESSSKALEIIETAERNAAEIIDEAVSNATSIEADMKLKVQQMEMELLNWKDEQGRIASTVTFDSVIHLNVGGHKFDTTVATMTRFPDSMLGAMFSGRHQLPKDKDGYYFIDQDGTHFRHIINFLRNPEGFVITLKGEELAELKSQAAYYLLVEKMFPFVFEKLPPQTVPIFSGGRSQHVTVTVVQDLKGIWKIDLASHPLVIKFLTRQNDGPGDIQVCTLCHKGYAAINGKSCNTGYYIDNFTLPLVKDQLVQSKCDNCEK